MAQTISNDLSTINLENVRKQIKELCDKVDPKKPLMRDDGESPLNLMLPEKYNAITILSDNVPKELTLDTEQSIIDYFQDLLDGDLRIRVLCNETDNCDPIIVRCDYCRARIKSGSIYECRKCRTDMCELCLAETSEEIAKANGSSKWHERKDKVEACRAHGIHKFPFPECHEYTAQDFGSMLDWIPVLSDGEDGNRVFLNCNPESTQKGKVAICASDNHGRCGYFIVDQSLQQVMDFVQSVAESNVTRDGWEGFYNAPLKQLLARVGHPIHYG